MVLRGCIGTAVLSALVILALAGPGLAGAWPRGKGNHFISTALRFHGGPGHSWSKSLTYFHEYGLTERLTLGADIGGAISGFDKAIVFLSTPLKPRLGFNIGIDMGGGVVAGVPVIRPGLAIGRGLTRPAGWITAEMAAEYFTTTGAIDWKLDTTFGLARSDRRKIYFQLQTGQSYGEDPFARIATSIALRVRPRTFLDLGTSLGVLNSEPIRLKIGVWQEF